MNELQLGILQPLTLAALLVIAFGTVIGLSRFYFVGTKKFSYGTLTPGAPQGPRWYASLNRVYINSIEALALFAPMVIIHLHFGTHLDVVKSLAWAYLIGRALYSAIYLGRGYSIFCSFAWLVGFVATLVGWLLVLA